MTVHQRTTEALLPTLAGRRDVLRIAGGVAAAALLGSVVPMRVARAATAVGRPMYQQDAQHTGRSPHTGPRKATLIRSFDTATSGLGAPVQFTDIQSSIVVGTDGTMYQSTFGGSLYALRDPGSGSSLEPVWWFRPDDGGTSAHATPAVTDDGTTYLQFSTRNPASSRLYALRRPTNGLAADVAWTVDLGAVGASWSPIVGPDGTVYTMNSSGKFFAVAPDGTVRWTAQLGQVVRAAVSLSPDGSTVYVPSLDGKLYAVASPASSGGEGTVKWTFDFGEHLRPTPLVTTDRGIGVNGIGSGSSPAIAPDGSIYVGANNSNFYAVNPDGTMKWLYEAEREIAGIWADPALSADAGTVYFGANKGGVYALDTASGALRWQSKIFGSLYGGLTLDAKGTLYTGSTVGHLFGIDASNGQWFFDYDAQAYPGIWTSVAVRPDGSLALGTRQGKVLVFGA